MESVSVNGASCTNNYASFGAGTYEIEFEASVAWAHIEIKLTGTCGEDPTPTPTPEETSTPTIAPADPPSGDYDNIITGTS